MTFLMIDALVAGGVDSVTASRLDAACARLRVDDETRRRIAQCAYRGTAKREDILIFAETAGLLDEPTEIIQRLAESMPMPFAELCELVCRGI